eukprot:471954-Pyramimonas_sp.AAC.1
MPQVPREFQQRGQAFIDSAWMALDERSRNLASEGAATKALAGGILMPLRKNHEAETHCASYIYMA